MLGWLTFWDSETAAAEGVEWVPLADRMGTLSSVQMLIVLAAGTTTLSCRSPWASLSDSGAGRGKSLQRDQQGCVLTPSYKSSAWGFQKPKPQSWLCSFLLTLLFTVQAAALGWVLPLGRGGMQGERLDGAASRAGEALISATQNQPYILISSSVILIFSGFERASRGPPPLKESLNNNLFPFLLPLPQKQRIILHILHDFLGSITEADMEIKIFWK